VSGDATPVLIPEEMGIPLTIVEAVLGSSYIPVEGLGGGPAPKGAERFA
jgi:hypothetical protein